MGAKVLVEALRRAGRNPTRSQVVKALESMDSYDAGGITVVQDPTQAAMSEMPASALRAQAACHVLGLEDIATFLLQIGGSR